MQSWTLPPSFIDQLFCLSSYCPPPIRLHTIPVGIMVNMFWGGGFPPPCFVSYVRTTYANCHPLPKTTPISAHNMAALHAHKYGGFIPSQLTRSVPTQNIPVGIIFAHPVGFSYQTRSGLFLTIFHTTDRDYSRSIKLHPTGTILVRENSPDRVSFVSFPPTLSPSARGRHPSYHASPTSTLHRLHFATLYISGTGSFSDLRMHTTSNTGRVICVT